MKTLLAATMLFGSTVGAMALGPYGNYRDSSDAKPAIEKRAPRGGSETAFPIDRRRHGKGDRVETYRYDDGGSGRSPDLRPRSWDGGYVPQHPRSASPDGFWSPIDQSSEGRELRQLRFR